ncbi:MAG TPA: hypothetical protein DEA27_00885 [Candidatus Moranbacteria bacterium]|nr:hypothetical protein [Candidatus Moranbacteria bacterium]
MKLFNEKTKKALFFIMIIFFVFVIGGIGGVYMEAYLVPRLSAVPFFEKFLKKASENVTVINRVEQVTIKESDSVNEISSGASISVVNIISINSENSFAQNQESKSGTGILVTSDGVIVTYRDAIIESEASYIVLLYNEEKYEAKLMGIDNFTNLAYLKIEANNLSSIDFANSNDFRPGNKLVAIGNSFSEYQNRFSAGLLSNNNKTFNLSGKTVASSEKLEGVFETDFDNQKNYLGGPVISYGGELVGIIGKVFMDNQDVFFQIPSNMVKESLELALNGELEKRPTLGAYYITMTKEYALTHNMKIDKGALIYSSSGKNSLAIIDGSVAQKAGLRINDLIIAVNGENIDLGNPFSNLLSKHKKGHQVELTVIRNENEIKIPVQL